jgi:hypothetical protein
MRPLPHLGWLQLLESGDAGMNRYHLRDEEERDHELWLEDVNDAASSYRQAASLVSGLVGWQGQVVRAAINHRLGMCELALTGRYEASSWFDYVDSLLDEARDQLRVLPDRVGAMAVELLSEQSRAYRLDPTVLLAAVCEHNCIVISRPCGRSVPHC